MICPVCGAPLAKANHGRWDYDCPRCERSYNYSEGYLTSKFEAIPRKFKVKGGK